MPSLRIRQDGGTIAAMNRLLLFFMLLGNAVLPIQARADTPVPERLLNPRSLAEAWNVLRLAVENAERLVREERVDEVTGHIVLCSPSLRMLAAHGVPLEQKAAVDEQVALAFSLVNLVARESMAGNPPAVAGALGRLRAALEKLAAVYETDWTRIEIFACPDHPENVAETAGGVCPECRRPLVARRVPYSFIYTAPEPPVFRVRAHAVGPVQAGAACKVTILLARQDGQPATPGDLLLNHAALVQVLVTDASLSAFYHLAAESGASPGEFTTHFTPASASEHHLWTVLVPASTALPEYHAARLLGQDGSTETAVLKHPATSVEAGGVRFHLSLHQAVQARARRTQLMRIEVADAASGEPVTRLEPFLRAFAHVTAVYADKSMVFQAHPVGGDILREDLRGGPHLAFKLHPPQAGLLRVFCVVKIDGRTIAAPLAIQVED